MNMHAYRRCDGARMTAADLAASVPIHPGELEELAWPIDLVEDWLLHASNDTRTELGAFLIDLTGHHLGLGPAAVIEQLGQASLTLHRLISGAKARRR
ncbi:MAG: hypothetical protein ACRDMV_04225 [Streptosporangiales bacterium]